MTQAIHVHALSTRQGGIDVYAFFIRGDRILEIADIARIGRDDKAEIAGFQRPEIKAHVRQIADYLNQQDVLFPNAVILALAPGAHFAGKRGTKNRKADAGSEAGVLSIPVRTGRKAGWIVDGQQRALALGQSGCSDLPVPVIAFVSGDIAVHREQFILVNKAKPLDRRLIDELLPSVGTLLPRDLVARRVPSALCKILNDSSDSPFHKLIRRPSEAGGGAIVTDSHITNLIRRSINDPRGSLALHTLPDGRADVDGMYRVIADFWWAVREVFPAAWGLPPERSRLMHGAGLAAMGVLMDQVMSRADDGNGRTYASDVLRRIAPHCHWTSGRWAALDRNWNDIQCVSKDIRALSNLLIAIERDTARLEAA
ncbi:DGQHR domain protein [Sphingobium chlorophenolicum L-1]|uniref:DGQHR domain protein n=1 Tax=Sphingobium chlorophenolicum L-1 TaxID=690566 RepID=F6EUE6_SPHCR|nr:DGQHR domain-containing protein DpdB [Sphingobium chlorophenolicum]AEG49599.1 DGQHR domain protein [Sphingobium chlorophenolicum L-1]